MRGFSLQTLVGLVVVLAGYAQAAEDPALFQPPVLPSDISQAAQPAEHSSPHADQALNLTNKQAEQVQQPPRDQQQVKQEQQPGEEKLLLGALRFDTLLEHMGEMQKRFFLAVLPESWVVPKFASASSSELAQVHQFLKDIAEPLGGVASVPGAVVQLAESGDLTALLQQNPQLPPVFRDLVSASTTTKGSQQGGEPQVLSGLIADLDSANLGNVAKLFQLPTELELPVSYDGLSFFVPVLVRNVSSIELPDLGPTQGLQQLSVDVRDILIPIAQNKGRLLFSEASAVFQGIELPQQIPIQPIALFSFELNDVDTLWSTVKTSVLSRLTLLGSDAPALFGPVMLVTSLPRVALSLNGVPRNIGEPTQLARIIADFTSQLRRGLRSFADLTAERGVPPSTQELMREPLDEFLNLKFLNFGIPVVGIPREMESCVFTPLKTLSLCSATDCPMDLSLPSFPDFLVAPEAAILTLQERIEGLIRELQQAVIDLESKINSSLPQGLSSIRDAQGVSVDEALKTAMALSTTLQKTVDVASFLASLYGHSSTDDQSEHGLLAHKRKLQSGLITLPILSRGPGLSRLELPGQGSLEQLMSLRELTSAVQDFVLVEGSPLLSGLSPANAGKTLGTLFREHQLPDSLLRQPLSSLVTDASSLPATLFDLNLGQFLSFSAALQDMLTAPIVDFPSLAGLILNPAAVLSLVPGGHAPQPQRASSPLPEFGTPSGKALHWRGTSALRQRRLSDTSYPTDADGDLEPPRRPQGSRGITRDPKSRKATAVSPETLKFGMPHGRGPSECFWTFQKNAEDLNEVGRGVWSASLALGSFLYRQPAVFWGSLEGVTTRPSLSAKYNTAGAAESQSASKKPRGITGNTPKETLGNVVEMASTGVPKVFRILELGSGVGLIGPLLRRLFARGDFSASSLGCTKGASDLSVEVYLSDTDPEALQMCERTQRLDESILGLLHEGICPSGCREEAFGHGSSPDLAAAKSPRAHFECSPGTSVKTFVRRLDWRHGGPWAADVSGISPQTDHSRVEDDDPESQDDLTVARTRGQDAFEWTREEVEMLQKEGALSLVLASDVLYDFNLTSSLSNLLCAILEKNPSCRCLLSHSRRLGIVCPTSSVAVDIYAEDFFDRFCSSDPKEIQIASRRFLLTTHPTPPNAVVFAGYSDPVETDKVKKLIEKDLASLVEGVDGELGSHKDAQRAPRKAKEKQFRLSPSEAEEATAFAEIWELTLAETQRP
ncbi:hypothetical protein cyc_01371 [Cyclospora cayetanensis]|uniref:Uncharacterized protein n=1 Tax=Cyclospora cayetanensis TaxID=88456 RepID=A0A1D3CXV9_9EIME|nr:hypothetical protein cyc_01371 [Cyclospora cayetanensis]